MLTKEFRRHLVNLPERVCKDAEQWLASQPDDLPVRSLPDQSGCPTIWIWWLLQQTDLLPEAAALELPTLWAVYARRYADVIPEGILVDPRASILQKRDVLLSIEFDTTTELGRARARGLTKFVRELEEAHKILTGDIGKFSYIRAWEVFTYLHCKTFLSWATSKIEVRLEEMSQAAGDDHIHV